MRIVPAVPSWGEGIFAGEEFIAIARQIFSRSWNVMGSGRLHTWRGIQGGSQSAGDVEVDLVGVDQWPDARKVAVAGSIRWRERTPFDRQDLGALAAQPRASRARRAPR